MQSELIGYTQTLVLILKKIVFDPQFENFKSNGEFQIISHLRANVSDEFILAYAGLLSAALPYLIKSHANVSPPNETLHFFPLNELLTQDFLNVVQNCNFNTNWIVSQENLSLSFKLEKSTNDQISNFNRLPLLKQLPELSIQPLLSPTAISEFRLTDKNSYLDFYDLKKLNIRQVAVVMILSICRYLETTGCTNVKSFKKLHLSDTIGK